MTVKQTVEITNKLGMHARPAMKLFELMREMTGAWTVREGRMVQSVRWMEGDAHRDGDA